MASGEKSSEGALTSASTTREKFSAFKSRAATQYTRVKQFTLEKIGRAETTEYDSELENLIEQTDKIKTSTERILSCVELILQPNPGIRLEEKFYSTIYRSSEQQRQPRPYKSPYEFLSDELSHAGNSFGAETQFGAYMVRCGAAQSKIGQAERNLQEKGRTEFIAPLKAFLEIDIKNAMQERRNLNIRRIDLDAAKGKVKRTTSAEKIQAAEAELRMIQHSFDEQAEQTRSVLRKIVETHMTHYGHLQSFVAAQREFYSECVSQLSEVKVAMAPSVIVQTLPDSFTSSNTFEVNGIELDRDESRNGKVLYDYEALNDQELSITTDQNITVIPIPGDTDYFMAEVDGKYGKVPSNYIQLL